MSEVVRQKKIPGTKAIPFVNAEVWSDGVVVVNQRTPGYPMDVVTLTRRQIAEIARLSQEQTEARR